MKVKKKKPRILLHSWQPTRTYDKKNLEIWKKKFPAKSGEFRYFFSPHEKSLYRSNSYFSGQNLAKFRPPKQKRKKNPILTCTLPTPPRRKSPQKMVYFAVGWKFGGAGGVREECGGEERDLTGKIVRRAANHHFNCLITFA
jgi:hypothetical protein